MKRRHPKEPVVTIWDGSRTWTVPRGPVVYFIGTDTHISRLVKIGQTAGLQRRVDGLRNGSPVPLRLLAVVKNYGRTEEAMHDAFAEVRAHGEWFDLGDDPLSAIKARIGDLDEYAAVTSLRTILLPPLNGEADTRSRLPSPADVTDQWDVTDQGIRRAIAVLELVELPPLG